MNLSEKYLAIFKSYARAFVAAAITVLAVQLQTGALDFTAVIAAGIAATIGPILKWLDAGETAFGRGSN